MSFLTLMTFTGTIAKTFLRNLRKLVINFAKYRNDVVLQSFARLNIRLDLFSELSSLDSSRKSVACRFHSMIKEVGDV